MRGLGQRESSCQAPYGRHDELCGGYARVIHKNVLGTGNKRNVGLQQGRRPQCIQYVVHHTLITFQGDTLQGYTHFCTVLSIVLESVRLNALRMGAHHWSACTSSFTLLCFEDSRKDFYFSFMLMSKNMLIGEDDESGCRYS
jgi:hypothetical protein